MRTSGAPLRCTSPPAWPCHSFTHKAKLGTLSASAQLIPNLPMATETRPENQHTGVFARCRCEPAYPCTVPGSGACRVGVLVAVAISAQGALPHSSYNYRHNGSTCMSIGSTSSRFYAFPTCRPVSPLRTNTELHVHEPVSTFGFHKSDGHRHSGVTHHGSIR